MRGEVYRFSRVGTSGHETRGHRFAVVVHASRFDHLSTWIVAPTSATTSAAPAVFRPEITIEEQETRVMCEQMIAVNPERLGRAVGYLSLEETQHLDRAPRLLLDM